MPVQEKATQFIGEYRSKLEGLNQKLQEAFNRIEYLELEVKHINEVELPEAQTKRILDEDASLENKQKKELAKYRQELQMKQEEVIVLQNAISQYKFRAGEEAMKLEKLFKEEKAIIEKKVYNRLMHQKKIYIDSMIEESKVIQEVNKLDAKLQEILVTGGRKNQAYVDSQIKANPTPNNPRFGGNYLSLSYPETVRFISGNYTANDYDYLKPYANKKDLGL